MMHVPLAYALTRVGQVTEARSLLAAIESHPVPLSASTAVIYLALGERETAVAKLVEGMQRGQSQFIWSRDDPRFAELRGDPVVERLWARIAPPRGLQHR